MSRPATIAFTDLILWAIGLGAALFLAVLGVALTIETEASSDDRPDAAPAPAYALTVSPDGRSVHLHGRLDFGISRDLVAILEREAGVTTIHLDSIGGRVAEARALVGLVKESGLATLAINECSSACTLVFIGGEQRYLAVGARLGFHRYGLHSPLVGHFLDLAVEQEKDMTLFRRHGVDEAFLERVSATPHETMWFPLPAELLAAGVVDAVVHAD